MKKAREKRSVGLDSALTVDPPQQSKLDTQPDSRSNLSGPPESFVSTKSHFPTLLAADAVMLKICRAADVSGDKSLDMAEYSTFLPLSG